MTADQLKDLKAHRGLEEVSLTTTTKVEEVKEEELA